MSLSVSPFPSTSGATSSRSRPGTRSSATRSTWRRGSTSPSTSSPRRRCRRRRPGPRSRRRSPPSAPSSAGRCRRLVGDDPRVVGARVGGRGPRRSGWRRAGRRGDLRRARPVRPDRRARGRRLQRERRLHQRPGAERVDHGARVVVARLARVDRRSGHQRRCRRRRRRRLADGTDVGFSGHLGVGTWRSRRRALEVTGRF